MFEKSICLSIEKVSSFNRKKSDVYNIGNLNWTLLAKTECSTRTKDTKYLSVYVCCNEGSRSEFWSCDAVAKFRLISKASPGVGDHIDEMDPTKFNCNSSNWGLTDFFKWEELLDANRGFLRDNNVELEAHIKITEVHGVSPTPPYDFLSSSAPKSDVILNVDGTPLHVSKTYLALHSPVFNVMFFSKFIERNMKKVPIKDVVAEQFIELLNVIYPSRSPITADSVEYLLALADRFQVGVVTNECENFLINSRKKIEYATKLALADKYRLSRLHDICIRALRKVDDFEGLKQTKEYKSLSDMTKDALEKETSKFIL